MGGGGGGGLALFREQVGHSRADTRKPVSTKGFGVVDGLGSLSSGSGAMGMGIWFFALSVLILFYSLFFSGGFLILVRLTLGVLMDMPALPISQELQHDQLLDVFCYVPAISACQKLRNSWESFFSSWVLQSLNPKPYKP